MTDLWFTEYAPGNNIGKITTAGVITEYAMPDVRDLFGITMGPDGNVWFTDEFERVSKMTPGGVVTDYVTSNPDYAFTTEMTGGPDGNVWFAETYPGSICKVLTDGTITRFSMPEPRPDINGLTLGPDCNLWFTDKQDDRIGKMTIAGDVTYYSDPSLYNPGGIVSGPDGNLWFTEQDRVGKITTSGAMTFYDLDVSLSSPLLGSGITVGADANLWVGGYTQNCIYKVTTAGAYTSYAVPTVGGRPARLTLGPDGNVWFTEQTGNKIGKITTGGTITEYAVPTASSQPFSITSGALPTPCRLFSPQSYRRR